LVYSNGLFNIFSGFFSKKFNFGKYANLIDIHLNIYFSETTWPN